MSHLTALLLRSAIGAARRAAEEKAELLAEVSELRHKMGSTTQELARLQEIEGTRLGLACNCNAVGLALKDQTPTRSPL